MPRAASVLCALAQSEGMLIASRVLQGGFGAILIPQGFGIIKNAFPDEETGKAFGLFGPVMGMAALAAPVLVPNCGSPLTLKTTFTWSPSRSTESTAPTLTPAIRTSSPGFRQPASENAAQ